MIVPLSQIGLGETGKIVFLAGDDDSSLRLRDLGFAPGERVTCVLKGQKGSMSAYLVRCAVIALREKNSVEILVAQ
ncbi:MAG: FeoA family protein [Lachnospirales bacterium]